MLSNKHIRYNQRKNAFDGFNRKKDSKLLDSITSPTLTLVTLPKFFISFCLILSLTSHMICEVELTTLNGTLDIQ